MQSGEDNEGVRTVMARGEVDAAAPPAVQTVGGPMDPISLGTTLMHEHIFVFDHEVVANFGTSWWCEGERVADAARKLQEAKAAGVDTIVDMTVVGLGRDVGLIEQVDAATDVNIVVATGIYSFHEIPKMFRNTGPGTIRGGPELMTGAFISDIADGIAGTSIRAGMLKCVWETPVLSQSLLRVHHAVCEAHLETGVPITVHSHGESRTGSQIAEFYRQRGVAPERVIIGHAGDSDDLAYLRQLLDDGFTVGFDHFGLTMFGSSDSKIAMLVKLCTLGYAENIILSQDSAAFTESWPDDSARQALARHLPDWNYTFVQRSVRPALLAAGLADEHLRTMLIDNPRRLLVACRL